jgi:eukaryotic-like serine/threonine-protein kinase
VDSDHWRRVDEVFNAAVLAPPEQRAALLERECSDDAVLRGEVVSLLSSHEQGSSLLDSPAFDVVQRPEDRSILAPGQRLGRYTLLKIIGRGSAGIVYEAQQDDPARLVALKVMRALPHLDDLTPRLIRRETQALARLEHHGIAAIYEAAHCEGWHYFAMERIQGRPITQHGRDHDLSLHDRIELMRRICDAVQYAHQRGVIHHDLKPSNILVTEAGEPKVLDFGLARIVGPEADPTRSTEPGFFRGTLAYTSPEQAAGADTDTRSDVYSLGVILFELLTGEMPSELAGLPVHEAVRVIAEEPPPRLSAAAGEDRALARRLRGDLETIVGKSLEKEPDRRYPTSAALSEDLGRYLRDEPVEARRSSAAYRLWKGVRRHRGLVATALAVLFLLSAAAANNYVQRQRAENARDEALVQKGLAEKRELLAEEVTASLSVVLEMRGDLRQAVWQFETALARVRRMHPDQPLHIATFLNHYAVVLVAIGDAEAALPSFEEARQLQRAHGASGVERARTLVGLGGALNWLRRYEEAAPVFREAIAVEQDILPGMRHQNAARLGLGRALFQMDDLAEAEEVLVAAWEEAKAAPRPLQRQADAIASLLAQIEDARERADPGNGHAERAQEWRAQADRFPAGRRRGGRPRED